MEKKKLYIKLEEFICRHLWVFYILSYTWGLLGTLIGHLIHLILVIFRRLDKDNDNGYFTFVHFLKSDPNWCFSIGTTIISCNRFKSQGRNIVIDHEYGHCVQNALFGPLVWFIVYIPSAVRCWYYMIKVKKGYIFPQDWYYKAWFEQNASDIGVYFMNCRQILLIKC